MGSSHGTIDYEGVSAASEEGSPLIVDVRNPGEYVEGRIPKSVNIPLGSIAAAFSLSPEEFKEKFNVDQPGKEDVVITSCKSGMRAASGKNELKTLGYEKVLVYSGSFSEWASKGGAVEKGE